MTTQVNTFEINKKSAKIGTLQVDRFKIGRGWQTWVPTMGTGNFGTGAFLICNEWRYKIENNTLYIIGQIEKSGSTTNESAGSGAYTFTLPPGCTPRLPGASIVLGNVGRISIAAAGPTYYMGFAICTATTFSFFIGKNDTAEAQWTSSSAAAVLPNASSIVVGASLMIELSPTCAALSGNLVP